MEKNEISTGLTALDVEIKELMQTLEQEKVLGGLHIYRYNGFWYWVKALPPIIRCQKYFVAHDSDIILATMPKCGTTWLKALTFSIVNRSVYPLDQSPVLTTNPHSLVQALEFELYLEEENPNIENLMPPPRIIATHMQYPSLPNSISESGCRIIYICRNPLDQFVSNMHFIIDNKAVTGAEEQKVSMDEEFDRFCRGIYPCGPFLDHVLGYWDAHKSNPQKVLFLKYEDLKKDINSNVKTIAEFIGSPFSDEELKQGLVEKIANLCSFEHLKNLEVNKTGVTKEVKHSTFFRNAEVGGWEKMLTAVMVKRLENIVEEKLRGSGLSFTFSKSG